MINDINKERKENMKMLRILLSVVFLLTFCFMSDAFAGNKWTRLVETSARVIEEVQEMPDTGIPESLLHNAQAIAVFPSTVSAGLGIGGKYGGGVILVRDEKTGKWSAPAVFTIAGGSIGWQIGGQATDIVLLFMSRRSVEGVLQGKIKLGADAAVAAGPVGRSAQASTDIRLGGILSYSRTRGLFAGAKLEGDVITQNWSGNKGIYGQHISAEEILLENKVDMPECADDLIKVLNEYN
jgi:lipid-binding SYLF domain-containing protein